MSEYPKEEMQPEEITLLLNPLHNYLRYEKIMSWLPGTDSNPAFSGISACAFDRTRPHQRGD
jgi:hypothetical protein